MIRPLWGTADTRRMVRENFRSMDHFVRAGRAYVTQPVTVYTYLLPLTLLYVGLMKPEYPDLDAPIWVGHLLTTAKVLVFWSLTWLFLGALAFWLMPLGLPFIVIPIGFWMVAVLGSQAVSLALVPDFEWSWLRLIRQATITLPATVISVYASAPMLRKMLGEIPELVPIWTYNVQVLVPLLMKLPEERRGRVRRIEAANQYVEVVTDQGITLLRMTLSDAVALLPEDSGWRCHRSLWIHRDEVVSLTFLRGQPQITDRDGRIWPISRKAVQDIRDWLARDTDVELTG